MNSNDSSVTRGEEIIVPIRVRTSSARVRAAGPRRPRRVGIAAVLLLIAALTAAGVWWIGHLSRHPLETPPPAPPAAAPSPSPSTPLAEAEASSEPQRSTPAPPAAAAAPAGPSAQNPERTETVRQRLASAQNAAAAGDLSAARSDFEEALRLDPQSQPAREGLQQIKSRMAAAEFRRWMDEGFAALNAGDPSLARSRFLKAKALRPEAPEVVEALVQTENRLRAARIEAARQRALAAEQLENWSAAAAAYTEALEMDPTLQFAQQGKDRAAMFAAMERRIAFFLNQPGVLDSDAQLENAGRLLEDLQAAPALGSRLRARADKLEGLIRTAKTPIRVTLASDSLTEVSVYRVGRLGRFGARELSLRPGTYTVVGSRDGYRDERLELVVKPSPEPIIVTIICKEKV